MKKLITACVFITGLMATAAMATTSDCKKQGGGYVCGPNNFYIDGSKVESVEAAAQAFANASANQDQHQGQAQGQAQGQTSSNDNSNSSANTNTNGGNSVVVEGAPKHTTSVGLGVNIGVSVPVNQGFVGRQRQAEADWWMSHGQSCIAYEVMSRSRFARGIEINCGDKG